MVSFLKYLYGYNIFRHNYLYLQMRSFLPWTEGWSLLSVVVGDTTPLIWINEETSVNKLIRIGCIWVGVVVISMLVGAVMACCGH